MNNMDNNNNINNQNSQNQNDNKDADKKISEVQKKSAAPIISIGITWILFALIFHIDNAFKIVCVCVLSFIVYEIVKKKFPPKKVDLMSKVENEINKQEEKKDESKKADNAGKTDADKKKSANPELEELNTRIFLYLTEMNLLHENIKDKSISGDLDGIEAALKKIQAQLNDSTKPANEKRIDQLSDFFDYYMPTTIKILNSYRRIESQNLTGDNAMETKKRVEESLPFVRKAFEKELDNMFSDEMMDITTDIDVLESMLSKDGLIDKNIINNNLNKPKGMDFFN
ncbi:MAG: 5-bromo-4-chloroindolyl phosphate hydrolysis family protein [Oscillospiraceae bacterium]|nr:5-bromo-4-chloroindolyl phosphate hydrolysis family protein [Oscillospiraceae bacterium]